MLSWWTKNWPHSSNIWDTLTNVAPLHSVYQAPSYEPGYTLLASFLQLFAYLNMLFILEMGCTAGINNIFKCASYVKNGASKMRSGSYGSTWYTKNNAGYDLTKYSFNFFSHSWNIPISAFQFYKVSPSVLGHRRIRDRRIRSHRWSLPVSTTSACHTADTMLLIPL